MKTLLIGLLTLLALPPGAMADSLAAVDDVSAGPVVAVSRAPVQADGEVAVEWESDPATCASFGRCGLTGLVTWSVPRTGRLFTLEQRTRGARERSGFLSLVDFGFGPRATGPRARVRREGGAGPQLCTDLGSATLTLPFEEEKGQATLGFAGVGDATFFETRCAGPRTVDLATALPSLQVPFDRLARGRTTVRIEGDGGFAAHGFRGLVRSSLTLSIGRARRETGGSTRERAGLRTINLNFRIVEVRGGVELALAGASDPLECAPLDSCGLAGSLRIAETADRGSAQLSAIGPARMPVRSLRAALGLTRGAPSRRVEVYGFAEWEGDGHATVSLLRSGEGAACVDTHALDEGYLGLARIGNRIRATYLSQVGRTRCPGPLLSGEASLARADLPLRAFGRRRVELRLAGDRSFVEDGWTGTSRAALTIVLERTRTLPRHPEIQVISR